MSDRQQIAQEYTALVLDLMRKEEECPTRLKNRNLSMTSFRLPRPLHFKLGRAAKRAGYDQTQLILKCIEPVVAQILGELETSQQLSLLDK